MDMRLFQLLSELTPCVWIKIVNVQMWVVDVIFKWELFGSLFAVLFIVI